MRNNIVLGDDYKDDITGFQGVATAVTDYMFGCSRVLLEANTLEGGKPVDIWVEDMRLTHVRTRIKPESLAATGGTGPTPPARDPR